MVMKIEDEIAQPKFKDEFQKAVVNLIFTNNWVLTQHKNFFAKYDLTAQQFNILRILRGQYPKTSTVNLLKNRMLDKMSDASRLVERLKQKGLAERIENKNDRRAVDILITQKGLDLLAEIDANYNQMSAPTKNITEQEAKILNEILDKMRG
jgi:DNA-binding MarR family transcriptional regulator